MTQQGERVEAVHNQSRWRNKAKNVEVCSIVLVEEVGGAAVAEELAGRSWLERRPPPDGTNQTPCLHFGLSQTKRGDLIMLKRGPKGRRESRFE